MIWFGFDELLGLDKGSWIEGNFLPSIQQSKLALFLCNGNQKIADQTMIWFGLDELLCLDKEPLSYLKLVCSNQINVQLAIF